MTKITIFDYGVGNLASLRNAFATLGIPVVVTSEIKEIQQSEKLILPGVGAFAPALQKLKQTGMYEIILDKTAQGTPILGICLGMQLFFTKSYEQGEWQGFNFFSGSVQRFSGIDKIPHMGWNTVTIVKQNTLFAEVQPEPYFYFVHSFFCAPEHPNDISATCNYGLPFCAAVHHENIWGVQFHPEKSQKDGLQLLHNFAFKI